MAPAARSGSTVAERRREASFGLVTGSSGAAPASLTQFMDKNARTRNDKAALVAHSRA